MGKKIVGVFICMLLIVTALPVAGDVSETESVPPGPVWIYRFFGIINNLNYPDPGTCSFDHVFLFFSLRIDGQINARGISIGTGGSINYDTVNGIVQPHFLCCKFTWVQT